MHEASTLGVLDALLGSNGLTALLRNERCVLVFSCTPFLIALCGSSHKKVEAGGRWDRENSDAWHTGALTKRHKGIPAPTVVFPLLFESLSQTSNSFDVARSIVNNILLAVRLQMHILSLKTK